MKSRTLRETKQVSSATATFRLNSDLLESLRAESEQNRTSLNTLVGQILQSYAEYHTSASKGGMISMPKTLLVRIIERLMPEDIIQLSEYIAKNELKDTILLMKGQYEAGAIIDFIDSWARAGGFAYKHQVKNRDDGSKTKRHSFMFQHDMGDRWSLYFVELFKFAFEQVGKRIDFQHTANTLSFEIEI